MMTRKYQNRFVLLSLVLVTFLALAQSVQACRCPDGDDSTLGKLESCTPALVRRKNQPDERDTQQKEETPSISVSHIVLLPD
jgi:hypothetical protein